MGPKKMIIARLISYNAQKTSGSCSVLRLCSKRVSSKAGRLHSSNKDGKRLGHAMACWTHPVTGWHICKNLSSGVATMFALFWPRQSQLNDYLQRASLLNQGLFCFQRWPFSFMCQTWLKLQDAAGVIPGSFRKLVQKWSLKTLCKLSEAMRTDCLLKQSINICIVNHTHTHA